MSEDKNLQLIKQLLDSAESQIRQAKSVLFDSEINKKTRGLEVLDEGKIIEGVFSGEIMVGPNKKNYQVPANYASKSKLVPGDILKLTILEDGTFLYKQIGPVKRKKLVGVLEEVEENKFVVNVDDKKYRVLQASVTYFKAKEGDKITVVIPEKGEVEWAAIENLLENKR